MAPVATEDIHIISDNTNYRKTCLVVGLGMVGIAFVEKLLKFDLEGGRDEWRVIVIGEEPHIAYNRVGLTTYFDKRDVEDLYLNPLKWYQSHAPGKLTYHTSDPVISIDAAAHSLTTSKGLRFEYDVCVLATGSDAALPPYVSRERFSKTTGNFVYRNISDLDSMIAYAEERPIKKAAVVGGGLLGLEAAHALLQLETVDKVILVERNKWVLSRQLDGEGGRMVLDKVRALGVEVLLEAKVRDIRVEEDSEGNQRFNGVMLQGEPDQPYDLDMIVYAVGITPRDNLAHVSGLKTAPKGGFEIDQHLLTSQPDVYAIGEAASFNNTTFGIIAPGVEMADVLAFNLTEAQTHAKRSLTSFDLSTKLKLMGVDVASFGDFFADSGKLTRPLPGSKRPSRKGAAAEEGAPLVKALTYRDPFSDVYKKYLFTPDGKYLVGGMMVGDCKDYVKLVSMCNKGKELEKAPSELIVGSSQGEDDGGDLDDDTVICSCHNVSKGAVVNEVKAHGCRALGEIKSKTKCGTGCGGCVPLMTSIFNKAMIEAGAEVSNALCIHFKYSRQELYTLIKFRKLQDFTTVMREVGIKPDSLGCEVCKPAIGSILSSLWNSFIMAPQLRQTQDTNDRYLANVQRDGSYSVVPRLPAGEITPAGLKAIGEVAEKFGLHSKITGGQRIDLFGANKQDLPSIWQMLVEAGFESGHAYGKSLRTVKSCVGNTWCRYGLADSVGFAVELETRYRGIRSPHKFKGGVSGCVRECAEAQGKDFGLIATTKGWNVFVGGNGGATPRHAELIAEDVTRRQAVKILDRYLIFYIRTADKLQRTARWQESYPGGLKGIKEVIIDDKLGICAELEKEMEVLVGTFHCEWTKVVKDPEQRSRFRQFVNTEETQDQSEKVLERGQLRPADWSENATPLKFSPKQIIASATWEWRSICRLSDLDPQENAPTSAVVKYGDTQIAIWNIPGRGLRASQQMCPHRRAFVLSDGLIGEDSKGRDYISCPLHKRNYVLSPKEADEPGSCNDADYQIMTFEAKSNENGDVLLKLPPKNALDAVLGTSKWMIRKAQEEMNFLAGGEEQGHGIEIAGPTAVVENEAAGKEPPVGKQKVACGESKLDW